MLVRCPYGRGGPFGLLSAQILAERGYHVLLQELPRTSRVRAGVRADAPRDRGRAGHRCLAARAELVDGRLATYGASYLGFVQQALAMDPPPELVAAIVHIGPHDFSRSAYRNGVFDLYNYIGWSDLVAHQESTGRLRALVRTATAERRLRPVLDRLPVAAGVRDLLGREPTWAERWLEHPQLTDPFWAPLQCGAALERITVPVLVVGWLAGPVHRAESSSSTARSPPGACPPGCWSGRGPTWTSRPRAAPPIVESLAWLDRYAGPGRDRLTAATGPAPAAQPGPLGAHLGRRARARGSGARSPAGRRTGTTQQRWYLGAHGSLSTREPSPDVPAVSFRYDPADPTPSPGGAILAVTGGSRDNRAVERRLDVLVFSSDPLDEPVAEFGGIGAQLTATSDNEYADLFVRLCDVDPRGRSLERLRRHRAAYRGRLAGRHGAGEPDRRGAPVRPRAPDQVPGRRRGTSALRPQPRQRAGRRDRRGSRAHAVRHRPRRSPPLGAAAARHQLK